LPLKISFLLEQRLRQRLSILLWLVVAVVVAEKAAAVGRAGIELPQDLR